MRKKNFKGRCEKRVLGKCAEVCRTYDAIQYAYADLLQESDEVVEIRCNILLDGLEVGEYTSDFVCTKADRNLMVRECVFRKFLMSRLPSSCWTLQGTTGSGMMSRIGGWSLMKKYDLLRSGDSIIRVLEGQGDRVLVIDCTKRTMPVWVEPDTLESYSECTSNELSEVTGVVLVGVDNLDADQRKIMHERYTMIAPILSFVADDKMRTRLICSVAEEHRVSKQTVKSYLCLYLIYMDVTALAPKRREDERVLTQDEKNIRWALNKFFYTTKKHSLVTAYTMMLKEEYCDGVGMLAEEYPSFYQFRWLGVKSCVSENRESQEVARWKVHRLGLNPLAS